MLTRRSIALVLVLAFATTAAPQAALSPSSEQAPLQPGQALLGCAPHPPIMISGDEGPQGVVLAGHASPAPLYRPGSGVVAGNGTTEDPYEIRGWCIHTHGGQTAIQIQDTRAHVTIVGNEISPGQASEQGLQHVPYLGVGLANASNVTVQDNRIAGHSLGGVSAEQAADLEIEGNEIVDNQFFGVRLLQAEGNVVSDNLFSGNGDVHRDEGPVASTYLRGADANRIENNAYEGNVSTSVRLYESDGNTIASNTIQGSDPYGIRAFRSDGNLIDGNSINSTNWRGVQIVEASENRVTNNTIDDPGDSGIVVTGGGHNEIASNHISQPVWEGIILQSVRDEVRSNVIEDPEHAGITLWLAEEAQLSSNRMDAGGIQLLGYDPQRYNHSIDASNTVGDQPIVYLRGAEDRVLEEDVGQVLVVQSRNVTVSNQQTRTTGVPMQVAFSDQTTITDSDLSNSPYSGLAVHRSPNTTVERTSLDGNRLEGANVRYSPDSSFQDAQVRDNGRYGIYLYRSGASSVSASTVTDNEVVGIRLWLDAHGSQVENNTVRGHDRYGIRSHDADDLLVAHNTVEENGKYGISVGNDNNRVIANVVRDNGEGGLSVGSAEDAVVRQNNLVGNGIGLRNGGSDSIDASENWWGCAEGPSGPACDGAEGDVDYKPWLTEPNPDAGAG